ncbi:MAG: hypothetical protein HY371_11650 [Devosia nanyangense]|uniref:Uncharacterized protein n=1 Tax=Paradevosia shaoguanensis TaxID=1335043 RepID=A0AA41UIF4_9HYPH|nr:hypothetical protein [Paradevosia shaoguanensis]KFL25458.1 hypothetical protein JP74_19380 [Devosia sp. 17-2-E-8]MBI4047459.1 hypothetical protein [Devosia nanyangense]QMV00361.1 hypothetical protein GHV40_02105 [Devosia sp. D6-9]CDP53724.1 hypothetical protein [Devosia sp. DBB001]MCF1744798.1 hypothetical protein [Paradevosia shaoguanensis]
MIIYLQPHRAAYLHIQDRLEQTLAALPRDKRSDELRAAIEHAVEISVELAYQRSRPAYASGED